MQPLRRTLRRIEEPGQARYLTCSCYHRLPLLGNDQIKAAWVEQLALTRKRLAFQCLAWVIMPEHFHLLVLPDPPRLTVTMILHALKRPLATRVLARWRELNAPLLTRLRDRHGQEHFWQRGGGYDRNIVSDHELLEKITYIHNNPVRRGLAMRTIDWPWSSARWYEGIDPQGLAMNPLPI